MGTSRAVGCSRARMRKLLHEIRTLPMYGSRTDLDQCPATAGTVFRRLRLLARRPLDILLLGDDDLLGLGLALRGARRRVAVLDADRTLLELIQRAAPDSAIELFPHDLRRGLPK